MRWPFLFFLFFNKADHTEAPPDPPVPPPGRRFQFQNPLHVNPPPLDFKQSMTRQKKWFWTAFIFRFSARLTETVALAANFRLTLSAGREKALYSEKKKKKKTTTTTRVWFIRAPVKLFAFSAPFGWREEAPPFKKELISLYNFFFINLHDWPSKWFLLPAFQNKTSFTILYLK